MNTIKTRTKYDFRTLKYCNLYLIKYKKKSYLISYLFALITFGIAIYTFVGSKQTVFGIIFIALGFLMVFQSLTIERKLDQNLERFFFKKPVTEQTFIMNEEKVIIVNDKEPEKNVEYDWAYITEVHAIPQFYLLFIGKFQAPLVIDRNEESLLEGTKEQLDELIKKVAELKPYKEINKEIVTRPITYVHTYFEENANAQEAEFEEVKEIENNVEDAQEDNEDDNVLDAEIIEDSVIENQLINKDED